MFLEINSLYFTYLNKSSQWIIEDYSLKVNSGECVGIAGQSGKGKSTLLRLIAGLEKPNDGNISIDGKIVSSKNINIAPEKRHVGMIFQDYGLFPHMSVAKNIAYGLYYMNKNERKLRVETMLELIQMKHLANRYPFEISGGQQQRVAIARALAPSPKLLLLDEPLSNLDSKLKSEIRAEMHKIITQTKTTCLFVSHDIEDLKAVCGRIEFI
ncbi:MAG: ABC transporter ATP-binding protein [Campylobacteraceae bacterium]